MKRVLAAVATLSLASAAWAEVTSLKTAQKTQLSAANTQASLLGEGLRTPSGYANPENLYDNGISLLGGPSAWPSGATLTGATGITVLDDIHMATAGTITHVHWVMTLTPGPNPVTFGFLSNAGGADTSVGAMIGAFGVTFSGGASGGLSILTVFGISVPSAADLWMAVIGNGVYTYGPSSGGTGVLVGSSHSGVPGTVSGNFHWAIGGIPVPEPATIGLLALGGLLALRRRR